MLFIFVRYTIKIDEWYRIFIDVVNNDKFSMIIGFVTLLKEWLLTVWIIMNNSILLESLYDTFYKYTWFEYSFHNEFSSQRSILKYLHINCVSQISNYRICKWKKQWRYVLLYSVSSPHCISVLFDSSFSALVIRMESYANCFGCINNGCIQLTLVNLLYCCLFRSAKI